MKPTVKKRDSRHCRRCGRFNSPHLCERTPPCGGTLCPTCCSPRSLPAKTLPLFDRTK